MEGVMKNLSTYISCFEFDKFEPIATEYEMEEKGRNSHNLKFRRVADYQF